MTLFKLLARRYFIYGFLFIILQMFLLIAGLQQSVLTLIILFSSFISYKLFYFGDELRTDILFLSVVKQNNLFFRLLFLFFFLNLTSLPYLAVFGFLNILSIFDFISLFVLFLILAKLFIYKKIFYLLFVSIMSLDIIYHLGYTCLSQNNTWYALGLLISHIILLSLLLKQYKEALWKHLII